MTALRVVVAEDHLLVREGITALLTAGPEIEVVGVVGDADALVEAVAAHRPDAVLTDIRMPPGHGLDGITAALRIRRDWLGTGVVVLSQHLEEAYVAALFAEGAQGLAYLLKERVAQRAELVRALRETASGGSLLDPRVVESLVAARDRQTRLARLTARERQVLAMMAEGMSNPSIASRLHLSLSSVEKHVTTIFTALEVGPERQTHRRVVAVLEYLRLRDNPA
jgi:DNA-binding NarL/FixJ family response regulator